MTASPPTNHAAAVAEAAKMVEEAYSGRGDIEMFPSISCWLAARRAAREAGYVEVMVRSETLEKMRVARDEQRPCAFDEALHIAYWMLSRDLAHLLQDG